ncbi:MAG: hypothetical protein WBQ60_10155 [Asticcacaulis sp.]
MKKLILISLMGGLALGLSACGGGSGGSQTVVVTPPPPADSNTKFGTKFAAAFKADSNAEPLSVAAGDVVAVDPTAEPSAVK